MLWPFPTFSVVWLLIAAVVAWLGYTPLRRWSLRRIPGPTGLPFLGNLPEFLAKDYSYYCNEVARKYGSVAKVWFGSTPWVLVSDPALIRKVAYKSSARPDISVFMHMLTGVAGELDKEMTFWSRGTSWKASRRAFESSVMHPERLKAHVPTLLRCIKRFVPYLATRAAGGEAVHLKDELGILTLAIVGEVAFGIEFWPKGVAAAGLDGQKNGGNPDGGADGDEDPGAELVTACNDVFRCLEMDNSTIYVQLQIVFPALRPLWLWLAEHLPDAAQRRHMGARQKVMDVSARLIKKWQAAKAAAAVAAAAATDVGCGDDSHANGVSTKPSDFDRFSNGHSNLGEVDHKAGTNGHVNGHTKGSTNGQPNGTTGSVNSVEKNGGAEDEQLAFREASSSGGISSSSFLAAMLEDRQRPASDRAAELELPKLTDLQVIAQVFTFIFAGFDTNATTITHAMFCLASHPAVQDRLRAELTSHPGCLEDMELLGQLPYLDAVLKESQRLYPATSQIVRDLPADLDLGGGIVLPKNTIIASNMFAVNLDPELWPQPDRFLPERHLPEGKAALGQDDSNAVLPFGVGPRMCVGYKLATMTVKAALAALLLRFRVELHPRQKLPLRLKSGLALAPEDGVWVTLSELAV